MRFPVFLAVFGAILSLGGASAHAEPKWGPLPWVFPYWGVDQEQMVRPMLEDAKTPHNSQWDNDPWTPQDWIESRGGPQAVMSGFYNTGVIIDEYTDDDMPVLEVGQNFMRLSQEDKRHVVAFVDYVHGHTKNSGKTINIVHRASGDLVGVYSADGLQLQ